MADEDAKSEKGKLGTDTLSQDKLRDTLLFLLRLTFAQRGPEGTNNIICDMERILNSNWAKRNILDGY